jgi:hypothetical protein
MASLPEVAAGPAATAEPDRGRARAIVRALAITQTVGYGTLYYAFAVFLVPMAADLQASTGAITAPSPPPCWPPRRSPCRWAGGSTGTVAGR